MTEASPRDQATPADRALRALADIVGDSRPRVAGDGGDPGIPVAATVVLLREGEGEGGDGVDGDRGGPEVLLIERPDRGSFAGAWVFPGGKLDDADRVIAGEPEQDAARRAAVRETWEETGVVLDPGDLMTLSVWDPPPGLALRIRTWFFVAPAPRGELVLSAEEAVAAEWMRPADALARHARGAIALYPPTWVTLHGLAGAASVSSLVDSTRLAGFRRFETVARRGSSGPMLLWPEDDEYHAPGAGRARHRLDVGSLPWSYTRTE